MMRFIPTFFTRLCALFLIAAALHSCAPDKNGIYINDKISSGKRDKFKALTDQLFAAAKSNDEPTIEGLLSREMLADPKYKRTFEMMYNESKAGKYTILDQYYIKTKASDTSYTLRPPDSLYKLPISASTRETYVALMVLEQGGDKWLATAVYGNYDYGWRLGELHFDHYAINGKTAPELYALAKADYNKGFLVDAMNNLEYATKCLRPAETWQYKQEDDIAKFYGEVSTDAYNKYNFPIIIPAPGSPAIFRIMTQTMPGGGYAPTIKYLTKIDVRDTVALKKEFEGVKKVIGKLFPGIDQDKKCIIFSAYNKRPEGNSNPLSYDMVDVLK
ncbi:hypothetical protein [uncultured Mucilaginibacter sp.]|uniref:hypothetical protein n=1 Tax=uncultured Mucilaginibacter sp. TaxID=797541 RepID=UPI0025D4B2F7|nr:hypothetical protein [uncultured Mucilaginibacter sp.]